MKRHSHSYSDDTYETLKLYADLRGVSFNSVVMEVLEAVTPEIRKVLKVLIEAQDAPESVQRRYADLFLSLQEDSQRRANENSEQIDLMLKRGG